MHNKQKNMDEITNKEDFHKFNINVDINRKYLRLINIHQDKICKFFGLKSFQVPNQNENNAKNDCVVIEFHTNSDNSGKINVGEIAAQIQHYIESLALNEAEDSSYDSDCDNNDESLIHHSKHQLQHHQHHHHHQQQQQQHHHHHQQHHNQQQQQQQQHHHPISQYDTNSIIDHEQVSRTTSDTLGQEFAEYITTANQSSVISSPSIQSAIVSSTVLIGGGGGNGAANSTPTQSIQQERSPGYTARVEFALKLGYTERLVQAALARLGPDPAQNELLAELIKLGAQHSNKGDFICDSPTAECLSPVSGVSSALSLNSNHINNSGNGLNNSTILGSSPHLIGGIGCLVNADLTSSASHLLLGTSSSSFNDDPNHYINGLRPIVIDGSNVAMSHGNKEVFSCRGIKLSVDWFKNRGHKDITVFVPKWRKESSRPDNPIRDQDILNELERERMLVFTPSRLVGGKRMVCYDDRYILKLAVENDGIIVSNDNYRDLIQESSEFKKVVEERVLMFSFVNDRFMPPDDPLGRSGPTLENFLRVQPKKGDPPPPCPYGKKCTYGNKCKFHHPERGLGPHKSVTERLSEHAARHLSARNSSTESNRTPVQGKSLSVPLSSAADSTATANERLSRKALCRTRSGAPDCVTQPGQLAGQSIQQQQSPIPTGWDQSGCHVMDSSLNSGPGQNMTCFPKSHSIENISREPYGHSLSGLASKQQQQQHNNYPGMWAQNQQQQQQQQQPLQKQQTVGSDVDESVNLHRKLRRQLTLNAAGCDPRIYQLQRCMAPAGTGVGGGLSGPGSPSMLSSPGQSHSPHRPLAPSLSGPRHPSSASAAAQWDLHQSVTRIASAPDPSRPWHTGPPPASSSEPHINLWPHHAPATVLAAQDQRRRLHYHLASIFPEEQVQTVMQMYPDETNPQTICAAILSMFPKI